MSRLTAEQLDEVLAVMCTSDDVRMRDRGVIAAWLRSQPWVPDGVDYLDAARELIRAQTDAGLGTFITADLTAFIGTVRYPERHGRDQGTAPPDGEGHRSDAGTPGVERQGTPGGDHSEWPCRTCHPNAPEFAEPGGD